MELDKKIERIKKLLNDNGRCLCGFYESCEICSSNSPYNILKDKILEIIDGPRPTPTLEQYGSHVIFDDALLKKAKSIKWRRYEQLPPATRPLAEGVVSNNIDFHFYRRGIIFTEGENNET